ncbi:Dol-P-Man:Man(5)GlcNAc(2)-PP-Dol alpha-1,3-mannosyltransferase [Symbiodinium microadriaticum]|uniref:Dol-P-Man:Man(5)GlcNAc(2)-PP-Dol alpha-1,3-mannosyltransferase n=1 Tax=Symbiodinium microadriaticum TaxID=2951 RepID=A0A1Q9EJ93_SYMMI|nr:Dol-P-Man:Man(5)GlcNAc(2)-PP-Dol alpha-1,3-mannosyltransferase [Symbiodinium microadriaticum]
MDMRTIRKWRAAVSLSDQSVVTMWFTCNFIGIACLRTMHFQYLVWYFHTIPFLAYASFGSGRLHQAVAVTLITCGGQMEGGGPPPVCPRASAASFSRPISLPRKLLFPEVLPKSRILSRDAGKMLGDAPAPSALHPVEALTEAQVDVFRIFCFGVAGDPRRMSPLYETSWCICCAQLEDPDWQLGAEFKVLGSSLRLETRCSELCTSLKTYEARSTVGHSTCAAVFDDDPEVVGGLDFGPYTDARVERIRWHPLYDFLEAEQYVNSKFQIGSLMSSQTCDELSRVHSVLLLVLTGYGWRGVEYRGCQDGLNG